MTPAIEAMRARLALLGKLLFDRHLTDAAGGNMSARVGDQSAGACRTDEGSRSSSPISTSPTMRPPTGPRRSPPVRMSASRST